MNDKFVLTDSETISRKEVILNKFNEKIVWEEKKYPLSDREKLFVNVIREILQD